MDSHNIVSALFKMADSQPDTLAIALPEAPGKPLPENAPVPYRDISFKELAHETNLIATGLLASGFRKGDRVVLMVPPGLEFFTLSFAFLQCGIIPVLIDPGIGMKNLKKCIGESEPVGFIGITKAHIARILLGWGKPTVKKLATVGTRLFWGGQLLKQIKAAGNSSKPITCYEPKAEDLSAILFTSGSTGVPKGVMYTHTNMQQQVKMISNTFGIKSGEIDLPTFPPFALFNPTAGMSSVIPDMDPTKPAHVDPERLIRVLKQYNVTNMFGSPSLLDRVGRYGEANNIKLPTLNRVLSAGAPVPAKTLRRVTTMLNEGTQILTPYGATESMPVASIGSNELLEDEVQKLSAAGGGICIGRPVEHLEAQVITISDDPIAEWSDDLVVDIGVVGEIVVKGKNVTQAYFNRDQATKLAKIRDGDQIRHRMGDLGYKDEKGRLWFCGRKAHRVRLTDKELYTVQCESVFNQHPDVYRTALVGVNQQAVLCVEIDREAANPVKEEIKADLLRWAADHDLTQDIKTILFHPSFPVDIRHNAKIFREKLTVWAAEKLSKNQVS